MSGIGRDAEATGVPCRTARKGGEGISEADGNDLIIGVIAVTVGLLLDLAVFAFMATH
jgi:hypothetical protein